MRNKVFIGLGICSVLFFLFYWYEFRTSQIKSSCSDTAKKKAIKNANLPDNTFYVEAYDTYYKICLHEGGL
ncbi:hypothetical protein D4R99_05615 [bacterium]|nr:MAG: hypothetical protein D4R99_05615 [bacterium]